MISATRDRPVDRQTSSSHEARSSTTGLVVSCAILAAVIVPVALVAAAICNRGFTTQTLLVAAMASGVCWLASSLALIITYFGIELRAPVQGVLGGMLFRMGL